MCLHVCDVMWRLISFSILINQSSYSHLLIELSFSISMPVTTVIKQSIYYIYGSDICFLPIPLYQLLFPISKGILLALQLILYSKESFFMLVHYRNRFWSYLTLVLSCMYQVYNHQLWIFFIHFFFFFG